MLTRSVVARGPVVLALAIVACTYPHRDDEAGTDSGRLDMGTTRDSGGGGDMGMQDVGPLDSGSPDVGPVDVGPPDTNQDVGTDAGYQLYHGWSSPIAACGTTGFNSTTATALGGMYPYNIGDSPACRAWKLAATICTTEPVAYGTAINADWTCPVSGGFTDPMFGTYCAWSTTQYSCSDCYGQCNAGTCAHVPLSLRNCAGAETTQN